jgi:hypothetical protein
MRYKPCDETAILYVTERYKTGATYPATCGAMRCTFSHMDRPGNRTHVNPPGNHNTAINTLRLSAYVVVTRWFVRTSHGWVQPET